MQRHPREPGLLPRPLALLGALLLTAATGVAIRLLPGGAAPAPEPPPVARHSPAVSSPAAPPAPAFLVFVDTAREPGFDLPAESRRTGVRRYALGHLVAGGDGCAPTWARPPLPGHERTGPLDPPRKRTKPLGLSQTQAGRRKRAEPLHPGGKAVANRIGGLRALGGDAEPVFGGPGGRELAAACAAPDDLAAAYRRVIRAFGATAIAFEAPGDDDQATVLRRARALRAMQRERPLRVTFTLPLRPYGLAREDVALLRTTRRAGAKITTVNLLAGVEPRTAPEGRLRRMSAAVRAAKNQVARAQGVRDPGAAWGRIALTPVLSGKSDLSELDARKLSAYATRHGLAWLSLRGAPPQEEVAGILSRTHR
ncbi:hypothetical protein [Nonomuraea sp. NPDC002799]